MPEPDVSALVASYEGTQERIDAMTRSLDEASLSTVVPCCPAWTVKGLLGHLTGLLEDRNASNLPRSGFEEWTGAQVERHRDRSVTDVLDTWRALPVARTDQPPSLEALAFDAVSHEHDLCHALGVPGDVSTDAVRLGAARAIGRLGSMLVSGDAPGVVVSTEDGERAVEGASAPIGLRTTRFDLMRLVTGRVSRAQASALDWDGDCTPILDALFADGFFTLQPQDVIEQLSGDAA